MADAGYVCEVFRSIQGEGLYVGVLQVFVRLSGCSLRCAYCDTVAARERSPRCVVAGGAEPRSLANPVDAQEIARSARALAEASPGVHSLSVTGGEPLEQPAFLAAFLGAMRPGGFPLYLETNGLIEEAARAVADLVDIVSLDVKLPSLCGGGPLFDTYRRVLPVFRGKDLFCKVVLAEGFSREEFIEAARLVGEFDRSVPFVIQPATPTPSCGSVRGGTLLECCAAASGFLDTVRVIPQCHRVLGLD